MVNSVEIIDTDVTRSAQMQTEGPRWGGPTSLCLLLLRFLHSHHHARVDKWFRLLWRQQYLKRIPEEVGIPS